MRKAAKINQIGITTTAPIRTNGPAHSGASTNTLKML